MHRTYIAPISFGLGDLIVSLPAIQALITENPRGETWLVARAAGQAAPADPRRRQRRRLGHPWRA
jgi:hypothetical protein